MAIFAMNLIIKYSFRIKTIPRKQLHGYIFILILKLIYVPFSFSQISISFVGNSLRLYAMA